MMKVVTGDIFKSNAQTLVNTVNCVGVMGKGLSLEFKKRFPDMFKDYAARCKRGEMRLGLPYLYKRITPPWVLLFPTKDDWRSVSRIVDIEKGLRYLETYYKEWGITSIAVPPLGCGLGELEWMVVGRTLYRYLEKLEIPVELYAPPDTPNDELTPEFLGAPSLAQLTEANKRIESRIEPGFIPIIEVLRKLEEIPYHWPIGRVAFQKLAYFGTLMGLKTGIAYKRGSFGPFAPQLKAKLTKLVNNGLIKEEQHGSTFMVKVGDTYADARKAYKVELESKQEVIERLADLFCRLNTYQAEIAATVHFAWETVKKRVNNSPTEEDVLNEVLQWKRRRKPPYDKLEIAKAIRNLTIHGWIDVKPSDQLSKEVDIELEM